MEKSIITFSANEQTLIKTGGIDCFAGETVKYVEAQFTLGDNWSGFDHIDAIWTNDGNFTQVTKTLSPGGVCQVPPEVLSSIGDVKVNLVGVTSDENEITERLTTYPIFALGVNANVPVSGSETEPITPSQFDQFVQQVIDEVRKVTGMTAEAVTLPPGSEATAIYADGILTLGIPQGIQGDKGDTGETGNGITQVIYNSDYSLTLVFDNGERFTTPPIRGERGQAGQDGRDGADGVTPNLSIGTVETLEPTQGAYVTRRGTDDNPIFDFGIPKGDKGERGEVSLDELLQNTIIQTNTDTEPYNFRATPQCGSLEYDEIVGASVGWNQLAVARATHTAYGVTLTDNGDGSITLNGTASAGGSLNSHNTIPALNGHVYSVVVNDANYFSNGHTLFTDIGGSTALNANSIRKATSTATNVVSARASNGEAFSNQKLTLCIIDLTLMLGSTIADYVYSLEQSTSGSGVAWLKRYFDLDTYHPHDSGSIQSVSGLVSHDMVGFNQWDEEWESGRYDTDNGAPREDSAWSRTKNYQKCIPNATYYVKSSIDVRFYFYDESKSYVGKATRRDTTLTIPSNAQYFRITWNATTYNHDICINLSNASKNGTYEPYIKHTYPLDNAFTLRGIPKLSDGKMYYDGDVWTSNGQINRSWGYVEYDGSADENWSLYSAQNGFYIQLVTMKTGARQDGIANYLVTEKQGASMKHSIWFGANSNYIYVREVDDLLSSLTVENWRAYLANHPLQLVYPLDTPTTETAQPYTNPQNCESGGTEEYVSDCIVPIGHETKYPMTLGDTMPNADGTYTMSVTITNGKPVISWTASRSLSMSLTKSATAEAETEETKTETETEETKTVEVKTEPSKTETDTEQTEQR